MPGSYFVHMVDDDPVLVYGPYTLKSAKDFARIGSQPGKSGGGRRAVLDGPSPGSRMIRVYEEGDRVWPRTLEQLENLAASERPRVLAPKIRKPHTSVAIAANPKGCVPNPAVLDDIAKAIRSGKLDIQTLGKIAAAVKVPRNASVASIAGKVQKVGEKLAVAVAGTAGVPEGLTRAALRISTAIQTAPIRAAKALGRGLRRRRR